MKAKRLLFILAVLAGLYVVGQNLYDAAISGQNFLATLNPDKYWLAAKSLVICVLGMGLLLINAINLGKTFK